MTKQRIEAMSKPKGLCNKTVALEIEAIVRSAKGNLTYVDAVVHFCEKNELEVEDIAKVLHKNILEKIKEESIQLNIIKGEKKAKLPF